MDTMQQPPRPARKVRNISPKLVIWIIVAVVLVMLVLSSFFVVDQTEQAVVLRLGKYNRTVGPGLQTKIPLGIEASYNVPTQVVQTMTFGYRSNSSTSPLFGNTDYTNESLMLTGDLNIIDVQWIVQYKIEDPVKWMFNVESRETTLRDISQSVMNKLVGDLPILSVMTSERTRIEVEAQDNMQKVFDNYGLGVKIVTVKLQNIVPPIGEVQDAFEDVNKAIQDMNRLINEGKQNYNKIIPSARGEANKLIQQAQGYASERVNQATGDVARFNSVREVYEQSKDITRTRLYIEAMESIINPSSEGSVTLIDKSLANFLPIQMLEGGAK
ncbi:MAG: FtsH protease activity modulator HflK [Sphaerochaeta sp.]|uniref:FtsH protease activity modulator HflK n=1 Tax=Sphaerochaeta sp. TaxID=1972642 RepID=UPI001D9FB8F8|nr:FtsH protease activity modulator HflK [uncultured Sphaerochaeta sp.]MDD3056921.1 FtsH protease activity modulator HflK [Sphaerochaeta sp.]MDD3928915.1 FtsH protease activity modulator HflK [Sphaerochaeta sp.]NCC11945.1 FtsH protease activity modulator HflK [Spirochaetia bacterium]NCC88838.1 FtsH protease activity modulator HflK [Spirochaetia bacterium]